MHCYSTIDSSGHQENEDAGSGGGAGGGGGLARSNEGATERPEAERRVRRPSFSSSRSFLLPRSLRPARSRRRQLRLSSTTTKAKPVRRRRTRARLPSGRTRARFRPLSLAAEADKRARTGGRSEKRRGRVLARTTSDGRTAARFADRELGAATEDAKKKEEGGGGGARILERTELRTRRQR